jgi:hypothetical protein
MKDASNARRHDNQPDDIQNNALDGDPWRDIVNLNSHFKNRLAYFGHPRH